MRKAYKWQQIAFDKELRGLLGRITGDSINYLQFRLIVDQAGLLFVTRLEEKRCLNLFERFSFISKAEFVSSIALVQIETKHCRRFYVVRLRPKTHQIQHSGKRCFHFWMDLMQQKYGPVHGWFELLCQERDIRRVSIQKFLTHLNRILKGTIHQSCAHNISMFFEKSRHNEIEVTVFSNTLRINRQSWARHSINDRQKTDPEALSYESPLKVKTQTKASSGILKTRESFGKSVLSHKGSSVSARSRYMTPSRLNLVTKKPSLLSFT